MRKHLKKARQKAGMTQQQMADELDIGLRYYQFIESGERIGDFTIWDKLEDITGVHQRILRQNESIHLCKEDSR
ncbi:helix-turn-helix domain-containing protein [Faecalitalea cylindroides]|uniref:helix-turn-helix domain-containing protein n=1 Tax=Faecalitalea cylindroides TaxID=39483 RepID=UPI00349E62EA